MRSASLALVALLALLPLRPVHAADAAQSRPLPLERIFAEDASGRRPQDLKWSADGKQLFYLFEDDEGEALWMLAPPAAPRRVVALSQLPAGPGGDAQPPTVDALVPAPRGDAALLTWGGDLFLVRLDGSIERLTETPEEESRAAFSPDGRSIAFVRDFDLHLLTPAEPAAGGDSAGWRERALTTDGEENRILNATTDWVYWEEIWSREDTGFWWSPDGRRIAYYRFDEEGVESYPLVDAEPVYPQVRWQKYPKAGTRNPSVRVGVLELASGATRWLETGAETRDAYLARVAWTPDGAVAVQRLARDQRRLDLLRCDAAGGACTSLLSETADTWINLADDLRFLADGRFLWSSERGGWRRLALHGRDGAELRSLGPANGALVQLAGVAPDESSVVVSVHGGPPLGAADRQVVRLSLADGTARPLAAEPGWNEAAVGAAGLWVHTWSDSATPPSAAVRDLDGNEVASLPFVPPAAYDPARLPRWEQFTIAGADGEPLPAQLLRPTATSGSRRHPVVMHHYGGPGSQRVMNKWDNQRGLWHVSMAQRGYAVLMVDNPASTFFGKAGEDRLHRRFGELELAAQKAGVAWLRRQPWADADRIGLWGWSGGGANTLYALLRSPGTWRAGVAGAPVTDWRLYDSIWTERYLDRPDDNPDGYRDSSPVTHLEALRDALLIVHGTGDDNVHPQNTVNFVDRLVQAGKPHEVAIYPGEKHAFRRVANWHFYERMTEFFDRHLQSP